MVVELKIKKKNPWAGLLKYKHCFDYIAPYYTRSGSIYTGLTPEDEKYFEEAMGLPEGKLSKSSDYWTTFPTQAMQIKFLSNHKRVATSLDKLTAGKDYLLINSEAEAEQKNKANKVRREAIKAYDTMSMDDMRKCLRLFGVRSDNMSNQLIESTMFDIVDKKSDQYLTKWVNNKKKDTEFIIEVPFEGDIKAIEDVRNLIASKKISKSNTTLPIDNAVIYKLSDILYFLTALVLIDGKLVTTNLVNHEIAKNFMHTATNRPWIKNSVCYIEGDNLIVLYDDYSHKNVGDLQLTYIK